MISYLGPLDPVVLGSDLMVFLDGDSNFLLFPADNETDKYATITKNTILRLINVYNDYLKLAFV